MILELQNDMYNITGVIDQTNAEQFKRELLSIDVNTADPLIFNAEGLSFISPAGLQTLLAFKHIKNADLHIINVSDKVFDLFYSSGFINLFHI